MVKKIIFVSHCILNTCAKVTGFGEAGKAEEEARRQLVIHAVEKGIQLVQLPCPEFTLYGPERWGHTREQFDNPFFREHCRYILKPVLIQLKAYLQQEEKGNLQVLGIVGVDGSPSCGVYSTCSGLWGGEFSGRADLEDVLATCHRASGKGVMMEALCQMMEEEGIRVPLKALNSDSLQEVLAL